MWRALRNIMFAAFAGMALWWVYERWSKEAAFSIAMLLCFFGFNYEINTLKERIERLEYLARRSREAE